MLYVMAGASGSGKTTVLAELRHQRPDVEWHDFDEIGVPPGADQVWRQQATDAWVRKAVQAQAQGRDFGLAGQCPLGELIAVPAFPEGQAYRHVLLDVADVERVRRLRRRGDGQASQDMLCWAAWMRLHHVEPTWRPDVLTGSGWSEMQWHRWQDWKEGDPRWASTTVDTTGRTLEETCRELLTQFGNN